MIKDLLEQPKVIILFYAPFCKACIPVDVILESILDGHEGIGYAKLDVMEPEVNALRNSLGVLTLPNVTFFHNGEPVLNIIGSRKRHDYLSKIKWLGRL